MTIPTPTERVRDTVVRISKLYPALSEEVFERVLTGVAKAAGASFDEATTISKAAMDLVRIAKVTAAFGLTTLKKCPAPITTLQNMTSPVEKVNNTVANILKFNASLSPEVCYRVLLGVARFAGASIEEATAISKVAIDKVNETKKQMTMYGLITSKVGSTDVVPSDTTNPTEKVRTTLASILKSNPSLDHQTLNRILFDVARIAGASFEEATDISKIAMNKIRKAKMLVEFGLVSQSNDIATTKVRKIVARIWEFQPFLSEETWYRVLLGVARSTRVSLVEATVISTAAMDRVRKGKKLLAEFRL
jgi:hypothetical protein